LIGTNFFFDLTGDILYLGRDKGQADGLAGFFYFITMGGQFGYDVGIFFAFADSVRENADDIEALEMTDTGERERAPGGVGRAVGKGDREESDNHWNGQLADDRGWLRFLKGERGNGRAKGLGKR
jgi:hypothetical protein